MMKNSLIILFYLVSLSCGDSKTGINIKRNEISIVEKEVSFHGIVPLVNQTELKTTGSDLEGENRVFHFIDPKGVRKIDLIFREIANDSLQFYQISARLTDNSEWLPSDTLKVFFNTSDSIKAGIYSILYGSVYCWTKPVQFKDFNHIEKSSGIQFAYWQFSDSTYGAAMPLGGNGFAFSLAKEDKGFGTIGSTGFKTKIEGEIPILSLAISHDFYKLIPSTFQYSFSAMGIPDNLRVKKTKPDMYNYLGWATWNAFQHNISEEKIINAARSLNAAHIPVKWFLIDDGWLDITDNKLNDYAPDKKKFPHEFSQLTSKLKKSYGVNDVGVWHTLNGYWEGLNDSGYLAKSFTDIITYNDRIVWLNEKVKPLHFVDPFSDQGYRFYDNWYKYLTSQGISFIKVDNQLVVRKLADGNSPFWQTGEKVFRNLHSAATKYFNGNVINCMSMLNNDFYHYSNSAIARTVEDYNPDNNDKLFSCEFGGNAASHVIASVHNSVWLSNIVWPDYDMFQSDNKDAWYYAIAKVMSNGPVYISDGPGRHNATLLKSITFSDGKVINADKPALPSEDCLFQLFESGKPFKVFSTYKNNGLLAAWNVSDKDSVIGSFSPALVRGLNGNRFEVFEFFSKSVFETGLKTENPVRLNRMGCKFFSIIPLTNDKAVIGDISKVIPMASVSNVKISDNSIQCNATYQCTLWIYSKSKPAVLRINSKKIDKINYDNNIISVTIDENNSKLEIEF
jgi:raffinose synthase